jgi:hypothetical protein
LADFKKLIAIQSFTDRVNRTYTIITRASAKAKAKAKALAKINATPLVTDKPFG